MKADKKQTLAELITESDAVEAAVQAAVRDALLRHKQEGDPVAAWKTARCLGSRPTRST